MLESQERRLETELRLLPATSQLAAAAGLWRRLGAARGPRELPAALEAASGSPAGRAGANAGPRGFCKHQRAPAPAERPGMDTWGRRSHDN